MKSIKGSKTEKNLLASFAGESQARNRYTYFASIAKKEGFEQISAIFLETAENEKEHAKKFFSFLEGGELEITAAYPAGTIGTTAQNLKAAADGEHFEESTLYPQFMKVAEEEGYKEVALAYKFIIEAEKAHEKRYTKLWENVTGNKVFKKNGKVFWKCRNCGYIHEGAEAPEACPACAHPKAYFEVREENY